MLLNVIFKSFASIITHNKSLFRGILRISPILWWLVCINTHSLLALNLFCYVFNVGFFQMMKRISSKVNVLQNSLGFNSLLWCSTSGQRYELVPPEIPSLRDYASIQTIIWIRYHPALDILSDQSHLQGWALGGRSEAATKKWELRWNFKSRHSGKGLSWPISIFCCPFSWRQEGNLSNGATSNGRTLGIRNL